MRVREVKRQRNREVEVGEKWGGGGGREEK